MRIQEGAFIYLIAYGIVHMLLSGEEWVDCVGDIRLLLSTGARKEGATRWRFQRDASHGTVTDTAF